MGKSHADGNFNDAGRAITREAIHSQKRWWFLFEGGLLIHIAGYGVDIEVFRIDNDLLFAYILLAKGDVYQAKKSRKETDKWLNMRIVG